MRFYIPLDKQDLLKMSYFSSKAGLAVELSKLKSFQNQKMRLEQYPTPSELAAELLWTAYMQGDLKEEVADFGCGTGILGLGALLLGCTKVYFVESEDLALEICKENYQGLLKKYPGLGKVSFEQKDVSQFNKRLRTVLQNPPFGTKEKHLDQVFLAKAMQCANIVYTIHKASTKKFIDRFIDEKNFKITGYYEKAFPLKAVFSFHKKPKKDIFVGIWRIEKR